MPRRAAGPRLYLRKGRVDRRSGKTIADVWVIRDGSVELSTGCGVDSLRGAAGAEAALTAYLAEKFAPPPPSAPERRRDPAAVLVVEVLAAYAAQRAPHLKLDGPTAAGMIRNLMAWWGDRPLSDVRRSTCQAYIAHRIAQPNANYRKDPANAPRVSERTASRELDILGGAIDWWHGEDTLTTKPIVWRPEAPDSPRDALTRAQAASLLFAALGRRRGVDGTWSTLSKSARANRAHLRRFLLIALYTGTRHSVITQLLWTESPVQAWVDLEAGMIYRRGAREKDQRTKRRPVVKIPPRLLAHMRRWHRLDGQLLERDPPVASVIHHGAQTLSGPVRTSFENCLSDAGLPAEITPHWLRHTAATWLMEADADPWAAAAYLGMTMATLEKHYGHHRPSYQAKTAAALSKGR
jgi:integrase